jgi:hypothetical protein
MPWNIIMISVTPQIRGYDMSLERTIWTSDIQLSIDIYRPHLRGLLTQNAIATTMTQKCMNRGRKNKSAPLKKSGSTRSKEYSVSNLPQLLTLLYTTQTPQQPRENFDAISAIFTVSLKR